VIDTIDGQLQAWVTGIAPNTPVSFATPADMPPDGGVNVYLFALADMPPSRNGKRAPLQFKLRYLVTTWSDDAQAAHRLLGELTLAAMEQPEWTVSFEALDSAFWTAMRVPPRPALVLDVPLRHERPEPPVKRVRAPLVMHAAPLTSLHGLLLGPDDIPLADARIEYPPLNESTFTDAQGHFRLPIGPPGAGPQALRVLTKGRDFEVALDVQELADDPLIIRVDFFRE
jgi:hypothetical protein